jgi:hypothetical protein
MRDIEQLGHEFADVEVNITGRARTYKASPRPHAPDEDWRGAEHALRPTPMPFDPKADSDRTELVDVLRDWAEFISGQKIARRADEPADSPRRIAEILAELKASRNWIRTNEQGPACADVISQTRRKLRGLIDRSEERWFAGKCGQPTTIIELHEADGVLTAKPIDTVCTADLYARPGKSAIVCDGYREPIGVNGCGAVHPALSRHKYVIRTLREKVLPLDAILAAIPQITGRSPDREAVKKWRQRGKLRPVVSLARHGDGGWKTGARYRGCDVLDLVLDYTPTRPGPKKRKEAVA